jgi:hypothetical protein
MAGNTITKRLAARYTVLRALYDATGGDESSFFDDDALAHRTGLGREEVANALDYLADEGLVNALIGGQVALTHEGIREVEQASARPAKGTAHFPPASITFHQTFNAPVGAVQSGAGATANVIQNVGMAGPEVATLIAEIRKGLPPASVEAREALDEVEREASAPTPGATKLKAFLGLLWNGTQKVVEIAPKVLELAQKLGVHLPV